MEAEKTPPKGFSFCSSVASGAAVSEGGLWRGAAPEREFSLLSPELFCLSAGVEEQILGFLGRRRRKAVTAFS
jgi:hypothetical protein